jgi:hypothetical protein
VKRAAVKHATVDMVVVAAVQGDEGAEAEASDEGDAVQMSDAVGEDEAGDEGEADDEDEGEAGDDANDEAEAGDDFLSGTSFGRLATTLLRSAIRDAAQHVSLDDVKRLAASIFASVAGEDGTQLIPSVRTVAIRMTTVATFGRQGLSPPQAHASTSKDTEEVDYDEDP